MPAFVISTFNWTPFDELVTKYNSKLHAALAKALIDELIAPIDEAAKGKRGSTRRWSIEGNRIDGILS